MFDVKKVTADCVEWIRDFFEKNGKDCNAVIGISGGKDSSVAAALCVEALGKDRVIGVLMPSGDQFDIKFSYDLVNHLGIKHYVVNIGETVRALKAAVPFELSVQAVTNLPPRIRMSTLYAVSQSNNGRVVNTCNLSEDWVAHLVDKPPIDGLCGKTDEDNLGFTYAVLDEYIRTGHIDDPETKARIDSMHERNKFKLELMPSFKPEF